MDYCYYFCWNTQWEPLGRRGTGLFLKRFPPFSPSASNITMKRRVFVAIMEGLGLGVTEKFFLTGVLARVLDQILALMLAYLMI